MLYYFGLVDEILLPLDFGYCTVVTYTNCTCFRSIMK